MMLPAGTLVRRINDNDGCGVVHRYGMGIVLSCEKTSGGCNGAQLWKSDVLFPNATRGKFDTYPPQVIESWLTLDLTDLHDDTGEHRCTRF